MAVLIGGPSVILEIVVVQIVPGHMLRWVTSNYTVCEIQGLPAMSGAASPHQPVAEPNRPWLTSY